MNRGHLGSALFREDADRQRFLGLLAELPERFGVELHAFVLIAGLRYQAAAQAVRRVGTALELDEDRQRFIAELKRRWSTIWMRPHCIFFINGRAGRATHSVRAA